MIKNNENNYDTKFNEKAFKLDLSKKALESKRKTDFKVPHFNLNTAKI